MENNNINSTAANNSNEISYRFAESGDVKISRHVNIWNPIVKTLCSLTEKAVETALPLWKEDQSLEIQRKRIKVEAAEKAAADAKKAAEEEIGSAEAGPTESSDNARTSAGSDYNVKKLLEKIERLQKRCDALEEDLRGTSEGYNALRAKLKSLL